MKKILKPYWLFITITIPQIILFILFTRVYSAINTEMTEEIISHWVTFGVTLVTMLVIITGYGIFKQANKRTVTKMDAIVIMIAYVAYIYVLLYNYDYIIPFSIPDWMFFDIDPLLIISVTFMPVMIYCILALVVLFMPKEGYKLWLDIVILAAIPITFYLLFNMGFMYLDFVFLADIWGHIAIVLFVASTMVFMFLAMRIIIYLFNKKKRSWRVVSIIVGIVLPLAGLILSQVMFGSALGDFSSIYFYIIAALNGILLILPEQKSMAGKLIVFSLKSIFYAYTLYFFVVFLPFIPLALVMTIAFGLGFLLLAPILLLIVHTRSLIGDYKSIKSQAESKKIVYAMALIFLVGLLVLPACLAVSFLVDKYTINKSLEYIYEAGYDDSYDIEINEKSLERTLENIENSNDESRNIILYNNTPYISSFYNKIVLDNATIGYTKLQTIRDVFVGGEKETEKDSFIATSSAMREYPEVVIKDYQVETTYDDEQGCYRSWLHFKIENTGSLSAQYFANFNLPAGCYISDYYLYVGSEKKMGLIADKRATNWIYEQIVNENRDPGILTYLEDDTINFRVFPFASGEVRKTGIEFVHIEPIELKIDDINIKLDAEKTVDEIISIDDSIVYIPADAKKDLTKVYRVPEYHFVIDCSKDAEGKTNTYLDVVDSFAEENGIDKTDVVVHMTNYSVKSYQGDTDRDSYIKKIDYKGGFFADRAVKMILYDNYINTKDVYPVVIVVTDDYESAVLMDDYDEIEFTFPECEHIYFLNSNKNMFIYSLTKSIAGEAEFDDIMLYYSHVLAYPDEANVKAYLCDDNEGSIILSGSIDEDLLSENDSSQWMSGVVLDGMNMDLNLKTGDINSKSLDIVRGSITSHVMTPLSSFIVLETEAQEKALLEKQKQLLSSGKQYLSDSQDVLVEMSEPPFWILVILLMAFIAFRYRKEKYMYSKTYKRDC